LRRLIGAALILLAIAVGLAHYGIVNVPMISSAIYRPVTPRREVPALAWAMPPEARNGRVDLTEGHLTALLGQLKRLPGSATVFYNLQAAVEPNRVEIYGQLFHANGFYRFTAEAEPQVAQGHLAFSAQRLRVQKIGLPKSYIQPLFDQLAVTGNGALLNMPISHLTATSGRMTFTIEPATLR
jgi:hypothetical protein